MSERFQELAAAVRARFDELGKSTLFVLAVDGDALWRTYLQAFPPGTDPLFRKHTEHDCSCCRHFIRNIGAVVAVQNGAMASVWDVMDLPYPYQGVANAMGNFVRAFPIRDLYLTKQAKHGQTVSHQRTESKANITFHHFSVEAPKRFVTPKVEEKQGEARTTQSVLLRGLTELKPDAVSQVIDLISSNALYRGEEHGRSVTEFAQLQSKILAADAKARDLLTWAEIGNPVARFRNTVIGTLIQDLSDGVELERAVRSFETKVAPTNYKRPTSIITKKMVEEAMKTIDELGLGHALERRHARMGDVSVGSVLFVDGAVQGRMRGGVAGLLMEEVRLDAFDPKKATEIGIEDFLKTVLPKTKGLRLYLDNNLTSHLVSVTAPVHEDAKRLFKWGNNFAWSYEGNVTDSIKDKVKRAGGRVENVAMRVSLAWYNTDDLDLHVIEPNGNHIYFGNKSDRLDVDMNVAHLVRDPVENVWWVRPPAAGVYGVFVHQFTRRESVDVGLTVEIEGDGGLTTLRYEKGVGSKEQINVAQIKVSRDGKIEIAPTRDMVVGSASREVWGLRTLDLVRVNALVLSPNHWDGDGVGNRHWFFLLEGCRNPLPPRSIYNEFLHPGLEKHRRVFEVLGDKMKCPYSDEQLSGVGFSSTRKDRVTVIAMGPNLNRPYTIVF